MCRTVPSEGNAAYGVQAGKRHKVLALPPNSAGLQVLLDICSC
jgi:hypothetical protein